MKFLVTGATGGLGGGVYSYLAYHIRREDFAAASSKQENFRKYFQSTGIQFRHVDYNDFESMQKVFIGVEKLLFVSSNTYDNEKRTRQHGNVIEAAKAAGVHHVYYTSLAFGGYSSDSKISVQQSHLATEAMLEGSGISYTSIREGIYAEAFPLIEWFPNTKEVLLPGDGPIAFASRAELAEATAILMIRGTYDNRKIVLLTGPRAYTLTEIVDVINSVTKRDVKVKRVSGEEYLVEKLMNDEGGKGEAFFRSRLSWFEGIEKGDGASVDPIMETLLGREPKDAKEVITELLEKDRNYEWHQNYMKTIP